MLKREIRTMHIKGKKSVFCDELFKDKVILVSDGCTGLGKHAAGQLARLGASLVIFGRDVERIEATVRKLGALVMARA